MLDQSDPLLYLLSRQISNYTEVTGVTGEELIGDSHITNGLVFGGN